MNIIAKRKYWFIVSGALAVIGLISLIAFGLRLGLDFTGGSLLEVQYSADKIPTAQEIQSQIAPLNLGSIVVQVSDKNTAIIRTKDLTEDQHQQVLQALKKSDSGIEELQFSSIGPVIGKELQKKSIGAIVIVSIALILFIAWSFRRVSKPVSSWKYGICAVLAMLHDVFITMGVFAILGKFAGIEVDIAFVAAVLTVFGYSINDTIVVFDRIRENLSKLGWDHFEDKVNLSVNETLVRSLNTSFTTLLVLLALLVFGGESIRNFVLALTVGIAAGTYSSIFVAAPLLVAWENWSSKRKLA